MHIVWDWNGTLFDDFDIIVEAANDSLAGIDAPPVDAEGYRDHYARPVHRFHDAVLGRPITDSELRKVNIEFWAAYERRLHKGALSAVAPDALDLVAAIGVTQSVLSMARRRHLVDETERFGVAAYMALVEGNTGAAGGPKSALSRTHIDSLGRSIPGLDSADIVLIGDSLDDVAATKDAAVASILYDGGSHNRAEVTATGVPVVVSLVGAVHIAGAR